MARLIALEWDAREARVAVARTRGTDVVLEQAFAVDLVRPSSAAEEEIDIGERIAADLSARGIGRGEALVAVGRASIELRQLSVPQVPAEELPDVVRFQALRQFTAISEQWPIDFVELDSGDAESGGVLAATISPEMVEQIRSTCRSADLTPKRLISRPFAAASLLCRHDAHDRQPPRLMVDMLAEEADLTVLADEQVVLTRTVRLSNAADSAQAKALLGEIRRTIASAQNQLKGNRIEKVILCGDGSDQTALKSLLEEQLSYDVELFDPLGELQLGADVSQQRPAHAGRFAPLIGMLLDEAAATPHAIDFLHPRKRPEPPSKSRLGVLIGATAAVAVLAITAFIWMDLAALDDELQQLAQDSAQLVKKVEIAEQQQRDVSAVKKFLDSDISWLDELHQLSSNLPSAEDMIVTQVRLSTRQPAGGQIIVDGYVRDAQLMYELQESLRWGDRKIVSTGGQEDAQRKNYRFRFSETQLIDPGSSRPTRTAAKDEAKSASDQKSGTP